MDAQTAINQPKFHHQWSPDELKVEEKMDPAVVAELVRRGQKVKKVKSLGAAQAVGWAPGGAGFMGAADGRVHGVPLAW
jgi:gamma-glutamyltranspeptidase/glutathione hydrolase